MLLGHGWHGVSLRLKVCGLHICGHLLVQAVFEKPGTETKAPIHTATQKFFAGPTHSSRYDQITNLEVYGDNLKLDANHNVVEEGYYTLTFSTKGGIGQGLSWKSYDIMVEGEKVLEFMRSLVYSGMDPDPIQAYTLRTMKHLCLQSKLAVNKPIHLAISPRSLVHEP